ncbi:hypothetical protein COU74_02955 [Candidatus Peregrinibacteria bacterium CG10_big_fil_rev_8_21_14_0_10_36_19]|nr:MAG: hypothetical protein COU74_02955 [Candidatus Peregrinibacteria bacterium CG10_big_fil_rev_8_21_14_0_10_36_19]
MELLIPSFLAGILTILAPCVLTLLPVIIGGSLGEKNPLRPIIIVLSLSISVIVFTLLLKATTALIAIPSSFWAYISGGLITIFGLTMLFPDTWSKMAFRLGLYKSQNVLSTNGKKSSIKGAIILGASLGPVFTTCSPTFALILAIVLPVSFSVAFSSLIAYAIGMSIPLLAIGYGGQKIVSKFKGASNPKGWFKKSLAVLLILTGIAIITGLDKKLETIIIENGYQGAFELEQSLVKDKKLLFNEDTKVQNGKEEQELKKYGLETNTAKLAPGFDLSKIASGGPGKDGIPAIINPIFGTLDEVSKNNPNLRDEHLGILIKYENEAKFYPYNILVWHEIVNDSIGGKEIAITFCPLCSSAIVYERTLDGSIIQFGVSGLLYESNLLMYDTKTESLWSQIEGRSVVGDLADTELTRFPMQVMTFENAKTSYPNLEIMSETTGYSRNYDIYPYGDYNDNEELYFPVSYKGEDYNIRLKEIILATHYEGIPIAFVLSNLVKAQKAEITMKDGTIITAVYKNGEAVIKDDQGNELVSYYAQWFSWANHNLEKGVNDNLNAQVWQE